MPLHTSDSLPSDFESSGDLRLLAQQLEADASDLTDRYPPRLDANWVIARTHEAGVVTRRPIQYWLLATSLAAMVLVAVWTCRGLDDPQALALTSDHSSPNVAAANVPPATHFPARLAAAEPVTRNVILYAGGARDAGESMERLSGPELEGLLDLLEFSNEATHKLSL